MRMTPTSGAERRKSPHRRLYIVLLASSLLLVFFIAAPVYPQTLQPNVFVGLSPNCQGLLNCQVTSTSITLEGHSSISYALLGFGYPTTYHTTTTLVLPTTTNASTGSVKGHTAYTITVNGGLDSLRTVANTTAGPFQYGCVFLQPQGSIETGTVYTTFFLENGTTVRLSNC